LAHGKEETSDKSTPPVPEKRKADALWRGGKMETGKQRFSGSGAFSPPFVRDEGAPLDKSRGVASDKSQHRRVKCYPRKEKKGRGKPRVLLKKKGSGVRVFQKKDGSHAQKREAVCRKKEKRLENGKCQGKKRSMNTAQ